MDSLALVLVAVLQVGPQFDPAGVDPAVGLGGGAFGTFLSTLVVGVLTLTGIGAVVSFCIGAAGFGTLLRA